MKKLFAIAILAAAIPSAMSQTVENYKVSKPIAVMSPLMTDSTDAHKAKYEKSALLNDRVSISRALKDATIAEADTAGWLEIATGEGDNLIFLETTIIPERYANGKLVVESTDMYEILVDGTSKVKKTTVDDSISHASEKDVRLELMPTVSHKVIIKLLSAEPQAKLRAEFKPDDEYEDVTIRISPDAKRNFEFKDLTQGARVTGVSISPDGKYLITSYNETFGQRKSRAHATLTDLKTGKVINENLNTRWRWMPRGSKLYYTTKVNDSYNVYKVELPTMKEALLIEDVPVDHFEWSPAEDYITYYDTDEGIKMNGPLRRYESPDDRIVGNRTRMILKKYDIATGATSTLLFGSRSSSISDISRDGTKMLVLIAQNDPTTWPYYFNDLLQVDVNTLKADTIFQHNPSVSGALYSPDAKELFVFGDPLAFDSIGLNCGSHPIPNIYDAQGYIYNLASGNARAMTRDFAPSLQPDGAVWNAADGNIYFRGENGFDLSLYQLNPTTGKISQMPQPISYIQRFSIGEDEKQWIAFYGQGGTTSGEGYLYDLKTGKLQLIDNPWQETADQIEWGKMEPWNFVASDGTEIEGWITYPPHFDPAKKYPMIVYYYGGTSPTTLNTYSPYNTQMFASRGYIVYTLNPSGTTGYGQEFSARHVNAWGKYTANDIIEGVKKLAAEKDFIDSDKIGAIGASYGGFMTQYLTSLTDIFAAAVSHAGISNVTSYWGEGYWGYSYNASAAAKSYPWTNPELFSQGSLFNVEKINTPLLLLHGTADTNVPPGESIQIFNALKILGKDVELITVDDEDHYISDPAKRQLWHNTIMAWFAKHLQDDPRWWDSIYQ